MPNLPVPQGNPIVIGLLGPVTIDGREVPGARAKRLLAALVLAEGKSLSASRLIDEVWGEDAPKAPQAALHTQISRLRALLGAASVDGTDGRYRLTGAVTDLDRARAFADEGDAASALALWRGIPGDDLGDDLGREVARRAATIRDRVDEVAARSALAAGDYAVAEDIAGTRIAADPLDEPAHLLLMRALVGRGRRSEALAVFARLRRTLSAELGVDPGAEVTALHAELLAQQRPATPTVTGLRDPGNALVGRDDDLAAIADALSARRVVTVQGPGGVGKTRIATAVGQLLGQRGATVHFVPLAAVRSGEDLLAAIAAALGVGEFELTSSGQPRMPSGSLSDRLVTALHGTNTILILDNCEQVIESAASLVDSLMSAESTVRVLITSRSPLLIPAEQVYLLPVLDTAGEDSAAVELFIARAQAVRPDAVLTRTVVAELCSHLDGLPLAIELAAARVRTMSVEDITARIAERFHLLRAVDRTTPDRHRTLYDVIDWSWELLDESSRTALTRLCLFPGGFSRDGAAYATGLTLLDLDDALGALTDQSLLQVDDAGGRARFRMLEMVREFGEARLAESGDTDAVVDEIFCWARDFGRRMRERYSVNPDRDLVNDIDRDVDNLLWVLRMSVDAGPESWETTIAVFPVLGAFWSSRGLHAEVESWGDRIIAALPQPPAWISDFQREGWKLTLVAVALHFLPRGKLRSLARARTALRRLVRPGDTYTDPASLLSAIILCNNLNQLYRLVVRGSQPGVPDDVRIIALGLRLNVKENGGDLRGAFGISEQLREIPARPDSFVTAMGEMGTASLHSQQGHWREGLSLYQGNFERFRELGADDDAEQVSGYIIAGLLQLGDFEGARSRLADLRYTWEPGEPLPQGNPEAVAVTMLVQAEYRRLTGQDSAPMYQAAGQVLLAEHPLATSDPGAAMTLSAMAAGLLLLGHPDEAAQLIEPLRAAATAAEGQMVWRDLPQMGNLALVSGSWRCQRHPGDATGLGLIVLADRLHARRDYPAMEELRVTARQHAGADDAQWQRAVDTFGSMGRRNALAETVRLLGEDTIGIRG